MEIKEYIENKENMQNNLLAYLDCGEEDQLEYFQNIKFNIEEEQIQENRYELTSLLHLIVEISNNYKRSSNFFVKIDEILNFLSESIKQTYSNNEIYNIFKSNKRILFFLFKKGILIPNKVIAHKMIDKNNKNADYPSYFYPEIKNFLDDETRSKIEGEISEFIENGYEEFDQLRRIGENHHHICELIRNDSIDEFVTYMNYSNISLSIEINHSIFETNSFLYKYITPSLIEYAAFYGSIKIFKYLFINDVEVTSLIWGYAIHGGDSDMIHYIEEKKNIISEEENHNLNVIESIKCHNVSISNYFLDNYYNYKNEDLNNTFTLGMKYYNYSFFPQNFDNEKLFYSLCQCDYAEIVKFLINKISFNINTKLILKNQFLFE